jgi:AcrR family transcriptional regulator
MPPTLASAPPKKSSITTEKGLGRAHEILHTARALLAADGYAGLSMRRVAAQVGMSLSNVQHYYQSKDALLEALLLYTLDVFQAKMDSIAAVTINSSRIDQFLFTADMFLDEVTDPVTHAIFFEIWALASRNAFTSTLMNRMLGRQRKGIYLLIRGLNPDISDTEYMQRAILMVAQMEGLMLFRLDKLKRRDEFLAVRASVRKALLMLATVP